MDEPFDTTVLASIVRNRLSDGRWDARDRDALDELCALARPLAASSPYARIFLLALNRAIADAEAGAYESAAREVNLVHNLRPSTGTWRPADEEYFLRGEILGYLETAPIERIKELLSQFGD